ncbi:hypothetical protein PAENIP36_22510 [Paenibacillus sp. P36]
MVGCSNFFMGYRSQFIAFQQSSKKKPKNTPHKLRSELIIKGSHLTLLDFKYTNTKNGYKTNIFITKKINITINGLK